jgi:hypothetical protein
LKKNRKIAVRRRRRANLSTHLHYITNIREKSII